MFVSDEDFSRADWELIAEGAVTLFWQKERFYEAKASLRSLNYTVVELACTTVEKFTFELSSGLDWIGQFGYEPWTGSLDALNDGLRDPPFGPSGCLALCFERFDLLIAQDAPLANGVLDVVEYQSRDQLLKGRRLLALVQTDDGSFSTPALGGRAAWWNQAEWLNSSRSAKER